MSDDDVYLKKAKTVHYGSLEEKEKERLQRGGQASWEIERSKTSASVNVSIDYPDLDDDRLNRDRQQVLEEFEKRKKTRQIAVSTDDFEVRAHLRHINEPICLFGEGPADRRERLRQLLSKLGEDSIKRRKEEEKGMDQKERDSATTWYHEGPFSLRDARYWIADYSIRRAMKRLDNAREERKMNESQRTAARQEIYKKLRSLEISCSQVGDNRPISSCEFSPDSKLIATSSWSGFCKLWSMPHLTLKRTLRGHNTNVCHITFHPHSTLTQSEEAVNMASCSVDGTVNLWDLKNDEPIGNLEGHNPYRVSRVLFHPSGRFLATCCHDKSWRLWDLETSNEVLYQEGHSRGVHDICFQCDGSLAATGGLDSFGRVWDLRTGRCIMFMEGHLKGILSIDFSPNGYQVVTGSEDHSVKVWNIRERKCEYTIAAHNNIVSGARFEKTNGCYIVTSSYDNTVKLWAHPGWTPIQTLNGPDKIMSVDMTQDSQNFITSSYDRTFKLWTPL